MEGLEHHQYSGFPGKLKVEGDSAGRRVHFDGWRSLFDLPDLRARCDKLMVILKTLNEEVFIGRLADFSQSYLIFDYLVLENALIDHINSTGEVRLKEDTDYGITLEPVTCCILADFSITDRSLFNVPMRRCVLKLSETPSSTIC